MPKRRHLEEMRSVWQYVPVLAGWQGALEAVGHVLRRADQGHKEPRMTLFSHGVPGELY
jgi:hypothetical protein